MFPKKFNLKALKWIAKSRNFSSKPIKDNYAENNAFISLRLRQKIEEKFDQLRKEKRPKIEKKKKENPDSFQFFEKKIFPLRQKNVLLEKTRKPKIAYKNIFYPNDRVVVVDGPCKGQNGTVLQYFPERGTVVVQGVNLYKDEVQKLSDNMMEKVPKRRGIYDVEGPIEWHYLRHEGYQCATFELTFQVEKSPESIAKVLKNKLNLCEFCGDLRVLRFDGERFATVAIHKPSNKCINRHDLEKNLQSLKKGFVFSVEAIEHEILGETIHTKDSDAVKVEIANIPQKPFTKGQNVISMLNKRLAEKAVVVDSFLNEIMVKFEGDSEISGPFSCYLFKAFEDGKIVKNFHVSTHRKRVFKLRVKKGQFPYSALPFVSRIKETPVMEKIFNMPKEFCDELSTPLDVAEETTFEATENV